MTSRNLFSRLPRPAAMVFGMLLPFFLLSACETISPSSPEKKYRDDVAHYCKILAKKEKTRFVRAEKANPKNTGRDLGVRGRQVFNQTYAQCMEGYGQPVDG